MRRAALALVVVALAGCATPPSGEWEPRRPAALGPERCDMGMLRMTKAMKCADELHRAPLWGRS